MNINLKQGLGGLVVVLSVLMISTAQLQDIFGPTMAKSIVSAASILNGISGGWLTLLTSQGNIVTDAQRVDGVEVTVDSTADASIAKLAMDPKLDNIAPKPGQEAAVAANAKGTA